MLNCHCVENESNTPDFILAQYLVGCLILFRNTVNKRERWYGRDPSTGPAGINTGNIPIRLDDPQGAPADLSQIDNS